MSKTFRLFAIICISTLIGVPSHGMKLNQPGFLMTQAITPFDKNGILNISRVPEIAKFCADHELENIMIMDYEGDGYSLRYEERKALVKKWSEQACLYNFNICVEVGLQPLVDTLNLARYCNKKKIRCISYFPEQIYKAQSLEEAIQELKLVSEAAPKACLLYNELLNTAPIVSTEEIILAGDRVPNLCGMETNINSYLDIEAVTPNINKTVYIYDIENMYAAILLGVKSISLAPNLAPRTCKAMEAAAKNCERDKAKQLQNTVNSLVRAATASLGGGPITYSRAYYSCLKAAFQIITGIDVGARPPFERTNSTVYKEIAYNLRSLGIPTADTA